MDITVTSGTNTKSQRITRIRVELSDHDLALVDGDPDQLLKVINRSRNVGSDRLRALADLAALIEMGSAPKAKRKAAK